MVTRSQWPLARREADSNETPGFHPASAASDGRNGHIGDDANNRVNQPVDEPSKSTDFALEVTTRSRSSQPFEIDIS